MKKIAEFLPVFNRLCVALRETADDSGVTQQTYFAALKDLSLATVGAAALALSQEAGRRFFPTTAEWRDAALRAEQQERRKALDTPQTWQVECEACSDTGWTPHTCDGSALCGRTKTHAPHDYVRVCSCRATNRTWQRHQQQQVHR